jgi:gluconolactonase
MLSTALLIALLAAALPTACSCPCRNRASNLSNGDRPMPISRETAEQRSFEVIEDEFLEVLTADSHLEPVGDGFRFTEGPAWLPGDYLVFSDIPADTMYRWTMADGVDVFRRPSRHANGNTVDRQGRLVTCEHGARRVTRTEQAGSVTVLAEEFEGKKLNSPNDAVVKSDGTVWFTDPTYGLKKREKELDGNYVFRLDPETGDMAVVAKDFDMPNGLCFSPDERTLYIADSGKEPVVRVFRVTEDNTLEGGEVFCRVPKGVPDGMRVDEDGRLFATSGEGVCVYSPEGVLLGKILTPETAANCAFGGPDGRTLYITASTAVHRVPLAVRGPALRGAKSR